MKDIISLLENLKHNMDENHIITTRLHYDDLERAEAHNNAIDICIDEVDELIEKLLTEIKE